MRKGIEGRVANGKSQFGNVFRVLLWNLLVYFMVIWSILQLCGRYLCTHVYIVWLFGTFPPFGMLHREKSGNPD
jgi:uncharacterized membrane protein